MDSIDWDGSGHVEAHRAMSRADIKEAALNEHKFRTDVLVNLERINTTLAHQNEKLASLQESDKEHKEALLSHIEEDKRGFASVNQTVTDNSSNVKVIFAVTGAIITGISVVAAIIALVR